MVRSAAMKQAGPDGWVLAVHGGAGDGLAKLSRARLEETRLGLEAALRAGTDHLRRGDSGLEAVVAAVKVLEDLPEFNAGRGSALTSEGTVETDASVADGHRRRAGSVTVCRGVRHPVEAARAVMDRTDHVLLAGDAVAELAERWCLERKEQAWFVTDRAVEQLRRVRAGEATAAQPGETVGAVARDNDGHLAAATSTGGRVGKLPGRVGDSPVVGAGTWADDSTCAVSATGHGEAFLLTAFAHEVDALMRLGGLGIEGACQRALDAVSRRAGRGGCIAVDAAGTVTMPFNTAGMARGWADPSGKLRISIGRD